jgi:hypothetical protein
MVYVVFFLICPVVDLFDDEAVQVFDFFKEMEQPPGALGAVRYSL